MGHAWRLGWSVQKKRPEVTTRPLRAMCSMLHRLLRYRLEIENKKPVAFDEDVELDENVGETARLEVPDHNPQDLLGAERLVAEQTIKDLLAEFEDTAESRA